MFGRLLRGFERLYAAVGADPCYGLKLPALFQATGLVNDHLADCWRRPYATPALTVTLRVPQGVLRDP